MGSTTVTMVRGKLRYTCEVCGRDIADGEGGIAVSYTEIYEKQEAQRAFDKKHALVGSDGETYGVMISGSAWHEMPGWAHWWTIHWDCKEVRNPYDFGVEDIRSYVQVVARVAHVLEKNWIQDTDLSPWLYKLPDVGWPM